MIAVQSSILSGKYEINRGSLRFKNKDAEDSFRGSITKFIVPLSRVALMLGFCMYSVFVFLDYQLFPETFTAQAILRAIGSSTILLTLVVTFTEFYRKHQEGMISIPILVCGYMHFVMLFVSNMPVDYVRSATGLMMLYTYYFAGVRFSVSFWIANLLLVGYCVSAFVSGRLDLFGFFYQSFWLMSELIICILSLYAIEWMIRRSYVQGILIREMESDSFRRQLAAKDKLAVVGSMASGIVHDFKNPLGIILGSLELADDDSVQREERVSYLQMAREEASRLSLMVQDILEYSRGTMVVEKRVVDLPEYLTRVRQSLTPRFAARGLELQVEGEAEGSVSLDPDRFLRVVLNIANNAAEVLDKDGTFEVKFTRADEFIRVTLRDNGPGIPEPIRDTIFQPFVTHGKSHGTGLGMAVVKSMVEAHGGTISFETETGKGTTFIVNVPA
ncbi:MAG: HAMP domain-containing histidine kinase [Leptospirales bacterium]|nr:HAMP domain-containing histidine kinase [Leptospirales bacterium]